jgi:MtrB/PioB family decaheme-associated outer membrane protein
MTATRAVAWAIAGLLALGVTSGAWAQSQIGGMKLEGDIEAGFRLLPSEPEKSRRAKFLEYRDIQNEDFFFLEGLRLRLARPDESYAVILEGSKWGQEDQEFSLGAGRLGLWEFLFDWDQTPHIFASNAQTLAVEGPRGVWMLPTPRPALSAHNLAPEREVGSRWDTARGTFRLTLISGLDLKAEFTRIEKKGDRPLGMALGSPGSNFAETLEPIDQTIHEFRIRAVYATEWWQVQFAYILSVFQNELSGVIADNPCLGRSGPGECSAGDAAGPPTGRISLAPDNVAHTFSLAGGVSLPMRTRVTGNLSYSLRLQDDAFLPQTINTAIVSPALALPQGSLNGSVGILLLNLNATTRPVSPLTLTAKYRFYDYNDTSDTPVFPARVQNDRTLSLGSIIAERPAHTRHNADVDGRWRFGPMLAATVGGGWERWDRNELREVPKSDEYYVKLALDATPLDWVATKLTYRPSFRRSDEYHPHGIQSELGRKFDQAERDRQRVDLLVQLMPSDTLGVGLTGAWSDDDYKESTLGLQEARNWSAGIDLSWTPMERVALWGGYVYESIVQKQRSRSRPVTGSTTFDFLDFDWVSESTDRINTVYLGVTATLIPAKLDWSLSASYSQASGRLHTFNPLTPTSGTASQNTTATTQSVPDFDDRLLRLDTSLRYHFWKNWTARLGYAFESFSKNDWRTEGLLPFNTGTSSIFLATDLKDYTAHIVALTLGLRF